MKKKTHGTLCAYCSSGVRLFALLFINYIVGVSFRLNPRQWLMNLLKDILETNVESPTTKVISDPMRS